jgi:hypothetical protein
MQGFNEPQCSKKPLSVRAFEAFVIGAARAAGGAAAGGLLVWLATIIGIPPL